MGYLKKIRKSFESIFAPKKESSTTKIQQQRSTHKHLSKLRFTRPYNRHIRRRDVMSGNSRSPSSSDEYRGGIRKGQYDKHTPRGQIGYGGRTIAGDYMLPTPLTSSLKRKRDNGTNIDGPALLGNPYSKRLRVTAGLESFTPISSPLGTLPLGIRDDDVAFEADIESLSGISSCRSIAPVPGMDGYIKEGSEEINTSLGGDTLVSLLPGAYEENIHGNSISERNESDSSISELSSDSSLGDSDYEASFSPPLDFQRYTPKHRDESEALYRPPPQIVVKELSNDIVLRDVQESDLSDDDFLSQNNSVRKNDKKEVAFDFSIEKAKRWAAAVQLPAGVWADAERDLILRLSMRGFEPMLPSNWQMDFPTLPDSLFAASGSDDGLLLPSSSSEFRAIKFFESLLSLTGRVRDRLVCRLRPEPVIHRAIKSYTEWALRDAGKHFRPLPIPLFTIYSLKPSQSTDRAVSIINRRLVCLANRHRDASRLSTSIEIDPESNDHVLDISQMFADRKYPVLTGFVICGSIVAILTLNSDPKINPVLDSKISSKFVAQFDLSETGQGVWNALAIAIVAVRMQKTLGELEEDGRGGMLWPAAEACAPVDIDA